MSLRQGFGAPENLQFFIFCLLVVFSFSTGNVCGGLPIQATGNPTDGPSSGIAEIESGVERMNLDGTDVVDSQVISRDSSTSSMKSLVHGRAQNIVIKATVKGIRIR